MKSLSKNDLRALYQKWLDKYYPVRASWLAHEKKDDILCLVNHALTKWRGLRKDVLQKHELTIDKETNYLMSGEEYILPINGNSCSLCPVFFEESSDDSGNCPNCPLRLVLSDACDGSGQPYWIWRKIWDPEPMIRALELLVLILEKEIKNEPNSKMDSGVNSS